MSIETAATNYNFSTANLDSCELGSILTIKFTLFCWPSALILQPIRGTVVGGLWRFFGKQLHTHYIPNGPFRTGRPESLHIDIPNIRTLLFGVRCLLALSPLRYKGKAKLE